MKYTQAELYEWAHDLVRLRKDPQFLGTALNKRESRQAEDLAKEVIKFAEDESNMEQLIAHGRIKKNKKSAEKTSEFSLTDL